MPPSYIKSDAVLMVGTTLLRVGHKSIRCPMKHISPDTNPNKPRYCQADPLRSRGSAVAGDGCVLGGVSTGRRRPC